MKALTVNEQIEILSRLRQGAAAYLIGVDTRTLRAYVKDLEDKAPIRTDKLFDGAALVLWWVMRNQYPDGEGDGGKDSKRDSPQMERNRKLDADMKEIRLAELREQLVSRERVHTWMYRAAGVVRQFGERMQGKFGPDGYSYAEEMVEALEKLAAEVGGEEDPEDL